MLLVSSAVKSVAAYLVLASAGLVSIGYSRAAGDFMRIFIAAVDFCPQFPISDLVKRESSQFCIGMRLAMYLGVSETGENVLIAYEDLHSRDTSKAFSSGEIWPIV